MKSFLMIFFIMISGIIFSQNSGVIKLHKSQIDKLNLLSEVVKYQTKNSKYVSWEVVANVKGQLGSIRCKGDTISAAIKSFLKKIDIGNKLYFNISTNPNEAKTNNSGGKTYDVLIVE